MIQKVIFCQFCNKYYFNNFIRHLQFCENYLKYNVKQITYIPDVDIFLSIVENKKVIIVGPSVTVQECNLGDFINSFDVIVRLNKSLPIPEEMYVHVGSRTDILYNSLNTTDFPGENNINPLFLKNKINYLRCPYPPITPFKYDIRSFDRKNKNLINFGHIDTSFYIKLENSIKTRPYTGTCAIADLLHSRVKELYVMGIDFYKHKHTSYYRTISSNKLKKLQNNNIHQREPQIDLIRRFYLLDERLVVDTILDEILLEKYDNLLDSITKVEFEKIFISGDGKYGIRKFDINSRICIIGNIEYVPDDYKDIDMLIDLVPNRKITKSINVYKNTSNFEENRIVLFTQSYKNLEKFKKKNYVFINPIFINYLKKALAIISRKTLSFELFVILIFSAFNNVFIAGIDLYPDWKENIEERLLFKYLLKRKKILYII